MRAYIIVPIVLALLVMGWTRSVRYGYDRGFDDGKNAVIDYIRSLAKSD